MKPALQIHPSWMRSEAPAVSATWRWFNLERWMVVHPFAGPVLRHPLVIDAKAPDGYASMLSKAAWIVAEAIWRDGVSAGHLDAEAMRWARRLGLALLGDGPVAEFHSLKSGRGEDTRDRRAWEALIRVLEVFPAADQAVLRLALTAPSLSPPSSADVGSNSRSETPTTGVDGPDNKSGVGGSALVGANKMYLLVRLSKRHAAASFGVDLRQSMPADGHSDNRAPTHASLPSPTTAHEANEARLEPWLGRQVQEANPAASDYLKAGPSDLPYLTSESRHVN